MADDVSQSIMVVLKEQFGSEQKAKEYLQGMQQTANAHEQEKKVKELEACFPALPKEEVVRALKQNNWNVEACFVPLLNVAQQMAELELKKRKQIEEQKKKDAAEKQAKDLMEAFKQLPPNAVIKALEENHHDIEATAAALCKIVEENEKKNAKPAPPKPVEYEIQMRVLVEQFPEFSQEQLRAALVKTNGKLQVAVNELLEQIEEQKRFDLQRLFPDLMLTEIDNALQKAKGNRMEAAKLLADIKAKQAPIQPHPPVELKESKVLKPAPLPIDVQNLINQQSIMIVKDAEKQQKADEETVRDIFKEKLEQIISDQVIVQIVRSDLPPGTKPPLTVAEIDEMKKEKASVQPLPAPVVETSSIETKSDFAVVLKATPNQVDTGAQFTVEYEVTQGKSSPSDWIGIFPVAATNKEYLTYQWRAKDETKGKLTFATPAEYGEYEFRYFCNKAYSHIAASNRVKVGPEIKIDAKLSDDTKKLHVKWTQIAGNTYTRSWVGLFKKQETNSKAYIAYDYANKMDLVFDTPVKAGEYEFRFFTNSYVDVARSNVIRIEGEDKLSANYKDGCVFVDLDLVSVDANDKAWIGLYFTTEKSDRRFRRYQPLKENKGTLKFTSPKTQGTYEARLYCNGYEFIKKSEPFDIPNGH